MVERTVLDAPVAALSWLSVVFSVGLFTYRRQHFPCNRHSHLHVALLAATALASASVETLRSLGLTSTDTLSCLLGMASRMVTAPLFSAVVVLRGLRLLLQMRLQKRLTAVVAAEDLQELLHGELEQLQMAVSPVGSALFAALFTLPCVIYLIVVVAVDDNYALDSVGCLTIPAHALVPLIFYVAVLTPVLFWLVPRLRSIPYDASDTMREMQLYNWVIAFFVVSMIISFVGVLPFAFPFVAISLALGVLVNVARPALVSLGYSFCSTACWATRPDSDAPGGVDDRMRELLRCRSAWEELPRGAALEQLLSSEDSSVYLQSHLLSETNVPTLLLLQALHHFLDLQSEGDAARCLRWALSVADDFILPGARLHVQLPPLVAARVEVLLSASCAPRELFDEVLAHTEQLLLQSVGRFFNGPFFQEWVDSDTYFGPTPVEIDLLVTAAGSRDGGSRSAGIATSGFIASQVSGVASWRVQLPRSKAAGHASGSAVSPATRESYSSIELLSVTHSSRKLVGSPASVARLVRGKYTSRHSDDEEEGDDKLATTAAAKPVDAK
eukprot:PLAT9010.1.p1 GENE.PLAT9010.1~~PLAT9010.1.p1  ORF type:complete len:556 (+),score=143.13 PLAT9010.1:91-1758(+)